MTCLEFEAQLADYLAGALSDAQSIAMEQHASECAACEQRLLSETAPIAIAARHAVPALPVELKSSTLAAVRDARDARRRSARGPTRWFGALSGLAAAAALVLALRGKRQVPPAASADTTMALTIPGGADTAREADNAVDVRDPYARAATAQARAEFAQLDAASAELRAALEAAPNDAQLRAFLSAVDDRRAELQQRVKDASS